MAKHVYIPLQLKVLAAKVVERTDGGTFLSVLLENEDDVQVLRDAGMVVEDALSLPEDMKTADGNPRHEFLGIKPLSSEEDEPTR